MGIVNLTPDSFSDGGRYNALDQALKRVAKLIEDGADIIDVGGESTRPGAEYVPLELEIERVIPVIEALRKEFDVAISVDTYKAGLMKEAIAVGVDMINDVKALAEEGAIETIAASDVMVCLMHMRGNPINMQDNIAYADVISEVKTFLNQRMQSCLNSGINLERIVLDPGFGFGKTVQHNYQILAQFSQFKELGVPLLAGLSRKSMLGAVTGRPPHNRTAASIAGATIAALNGARIIRVHDVAETADALAVYQATVKEI